MNQVEQRHQLHESLWKIAVDLPLPQGWQLHEVGCNECPLRYQEAPMKTAGFTLIEVMVAVAIVGVWVRWSCPRHQR